MPNRLCILLIVLGWSWASLDASGKLPEPAFEKLAQRLASDGWDSVRISWLFQDDRVRFIPALVELNLVPKEIPDIYREFLSSAQVEDGREFLHTWRMQISGALRGTKIPEEIAVAILKVESDLGRKPGKYPILSSLATITLLEDSLQWAARYDTSGGVNLEKLERRAVRRARWAYQELKHFLNVCAAYHWDPLELKGSWAGAFGWAQFLPSSYLRCAQDGDGDGTIDPFSLQDAVASMACYLQEAGWRSDSASRRKALMLYNPSSAYVDCILEYSKKLQEREKAGNSDAVDCDFGK